MKTGFNIRHKHLGSSPSVPRIRNFDADLQNILKIISKIYASDNKNQLLSFLKDLEHCIIPSIIIIFKKCLIDFLLINFLLSTTKYQLLSLRNNYNT